MKLEQAARAFERNGFSVRVFAQAEEVKAAFAEQLRDVREVGFGGSATLRELGLDEIARRSGATFHDHWQPGLSRNDEWEIRLRQGRADLFVTSANAATVAGELLLVDGIGNRLAAAVFGPRHVLFVVGENKLTDNVEAARRRVREIAGPQRAAQMGVDVPCAKTGVCTDCRSPKRICRGTLIIERPSMGLTATVWLVRGAYGL
ncbi:MAG TPA: lactate utilization protein [bacterium]|nr:lactate utilization protein [bacterium]